MKWNTREYCGVSRRLPQLSLAYGGETCQSHERRGAGLLRGLAADARHAHAARPAQATERHRDGAVRVLHANGTPFKKTKKNIYTRALDVAYTSPSLAHFFSLDVDECLKNQWPPASVTRYSLASEFESDESCYL